MPAGPHVVSTAPRKLSRKRTVGPEFRCRGPAICASENSPCSGATQLLTALFPRSSTHLSARNIPGIAATIRGNTKNPDPILQAGVGKECPNASMPIRPKFSYTHSDEGALAAKSVIEGHALTSHGVHKTPTAICETAHRTGSEPTGPWAEALPPPRLS